MDRNQEGIAILVKSAMGINMIDPTINASCKCNGFNNDTGDRCCTSMVTYRLLPRFLNDPK